MKIPLSRRGASDSMQKNNYLAIILVVLIVSIGCTVQGVSGQDLQTERHSIKVVLIPGNDYALGGNENLSDFRSLLQGTSLESGLGLNLNVSRTLSEVNLTDAKLIIICAPKGYMISDSNVRDFVDGGGSLFLLSNYFSALYSNCSSVLNSILNEINMTSLTFGNNSITVSNSSANWQTRVYGDNSLAVRVNSSMFQFGQSSQWVINGLSDVVALSCSLNITRPSDPTFAGLASAQSDTGLDKWLLLSDNGTNRIALCGSASMFNDTYINVENNRSLLRNLILWLIQKFQVSPPDVSTFMALISAVITVVGVVIYVAYAKRRAPA
jgi:hypothetical protein